MRRSLIIWCVVWCAYAALAVASLVMVNMYASWLQACETPLDVPINLVDSGAHYQYQLEALPPMHYHCMVDVVSPSAGAARTASDFDFETSELKKAVDVELQVELVDADGRPELQYQGSTKDWSVGSPGRSPGSTHSMVKPGFQSSPLTTYVVKVDVIRGNPSAARFKPRLVVYSNSDPDGVLRVGLLAVWAIILLAIGIGVGAVQLALHVARRRRTTTA